MQLLGKSLENMFTFCNKKFSVRCVCNIGYQMIDILKYIHSKHIIHQDIKPDNFVVGYNSNENKLYLLDFGLARKYRSSTTKKHYPKIEKKKLTGTARYASINALNGTTQSRRDDLESVGYVLMYFLRGNLPWQGLVVKNKNDKYSAIKEKKMSTSPSELCKGFPKEFEEYVNYTRNLDYEDEPDYNYLKNLFLNVLKNKGYHFDYYCDWCEDVNYRNNESYNHTNHNNHTYHNNHTNYNNNINYTLNNNNSMNNHENSNHDSKKNSRYVIIPEKPQNENINNSNFKSLEKPFKGNYYENIYNNQNFRSLNKNKINNDSNKFNEYNNHNEHSNFLIQNTTKNNDQEIKNNNQNSIDSKNEKNYIKEEQNKQNINDNNNYNNNKNDEKNYENNHKKSKNENINCCKIF